MKDQLKAVMQETTGCMHWEVDASCLDWGSLRLMGPDVASFLQRLITVDVSCLVAGQGGSACWLNPQGKIESFFELWNLGDQQYAFELERGKDQMWEKNLRFLLEKYHFREKIEVISGFQGACTFFFLPASTTMPQGTWSVEGVRVCSHGSHQYGRPWCTIWGEWERFSEEVSWEVLERWRIEAMGPRVDREITHKSSPLELGLSRVIAKKGCYPGQEVIERTLSQGSPARRLVRIEGDGVPGEVVLDQEGSTLGSFTSVALAERGFQSLALLGKIHAQEGNVLREGMIAKVASYALDS
jgi:folate-binding protein YgfZ